MSSSLDLPRTGKSLPIALALRALRACEAVHARDGSAVAGGGLVVNPRRPARRPGPGVQGGSRLRNVRLFKGSVRPACQV